MQERRKITNLILTLAAVGLGFFAQSRFRIPSVRDALILYAVAVAIFVYAFRREREAPAEPCPVPSRGFELANTRWGILLLSGSGISIIFSLRLFQKGIHPNGAWVLYLLSILLFAAAFLVMRTWKLEVGSWKLDSNLQPPTSNLQPRVEMISLALIVALGIFMRVYQLGSFPDCIWFDEAQNGLEALKLLADTNYRPIFIAELTQLPALFFYLIALFFKLAGVSVLTIRLVTTLAGLFTIPIFYLFVRELFGQRVALASAFLLAVSRWHVNFSRFGMNGILAPLFAALALYFLLKGLRTREPLDFLWGGMALGGGMYTYIGFWLIPVVVVFFLLHRLLQERRNFIRTYGSCLLLFIVASLLVFAPLGWYASRNTKAFRARSETVSVVRGRSRAEAMRLLRENVEKHLLMFNYHGDPNGRHNLPSEPMLDPLSGVFFVLGLGYSLYRWRRPKCFLLIVWFGLMLLMGILSLEYEAPQAYRTIGIIPALCALAGLAIGKIWEAFLEGFGRACERYFGAALLIPLVLIARSNYDTFFNKQAKDFAVWAAYSSTETEIARFLQSLPGDYDVHISPIYIGHPTIRFLVPRYEGGKPFDLMNDVPVKGNVDKDMVYILERSFDYVVPILQACYPGGVFKAEEDPYGHVMFVSGVVDKEEIAAIRGLEGQYYAGLEPEGEPLVRRTDQIIDFDWQAENAPLPAPFNVQWEGSIFVPRYGRYTIAIESLGPSVVRIDGDVVVESEEGVDYVENNLDLAKGLHAIEVSYAQEGEEGGIKLYWASSGVAKQVVPSNMLYLPAVPNEGLLGSYYPNDSWTGPPAFTQVDLAISFYFHIYPLHRPYSVEWKGKIHAPVTGLYRFGTESIDFSWLYINEKLVVDNSQVINQYREGAIELDEGWHDIRVRFVNRSDHSHVYLYWTPPGGIKEIVPSTRLFIGHGEYPSPGELPPPPVAVPTPSPEKPEVMPEVGPLPMGVAPFLLQWGKQGSRDGQFEGPRGIAVDAAGNVYVADLGNHRVQKFDAQGEFLLAWGKEGKGKGQFLEPFDLAVDSQGNVYVLDSLRQSVQSFSSEGKFIQSLEPGVDFYNPRGIAIDGEDNLYVADTGGNGVIKLSADGRLLAQYGGPEFMYQPTDMAVDGGGNIYVVNAGLPIMQKLDRSGRLLKQWGISVANSFDSPHLAMGPGGELYITDPEQGRVIVYNLEGEPLEAWGERGTGDGQFGKPLGIAVDNKGNIYVTDPYNHRVQKFGENE
jgi:4-amino-4-deoxy-L-arabinose transferase-like glycosyltransferase/sugar lactone lactonase YvrE